MKIKWTGKTTSMKKTWKEEAKSYNELWWKLVDRDIMHVEQYDEYVERMIEEDGAECIDEDGNYIEEVFEQFMNKMEEDDFHTLIELSTGNAYHQTFEIVEG